MIRLGAPEDWDDAIAVWRLADEARRGGVPSPDPAGHRVRLAFAVPGAFTVVAVDDDAGIIGIVLGMQGREDDGAGPPIPGLLHVTMLSVHPAYWQQGIGGALMERLLDEAWARDYSRAQLWTQWSNTRAQGFYEHRGWFRSGREKLDDEGTLVVHYARAL